MEYKIISDSTELTFCEVKNPSQKNYYRHCHAGFEFLLFLEGDAEYVIENRRYSLTPNNLIIIKPSEYHYLSIKSRKPYSRYVINFQAETVPEILLQKLMDCPSVLKLEEDDELLSLFRKPYRYEMEFGETSRPLINSVITQIICLAAQNMRQTDRIATNSRLTGEVIKYVSENLSKPFTLDDIAEKLYVSKSYMCHTFIKEMKITVMQYVRNKKILLAENMISAGKSVSAAAMLCGFEDYSTFYRLYKKILGISPSRYRKAHNAQ